MSPSDQRLIARLAALPPRIEQLATDPSSVRAPWTRLTRALRGRPGAAPAVRTTAVRALLERLRGEPANALDRRSLIAAVRELERNVDALEQVCVLRDAPMVAHAGWLRRLHEVLSLAARAVLDAPSPVTRRIAAAVAPHRLLPPLVLATPSGDTDAGASVAPAPARVLALELGAVDHLIELARDEHAVLGRQRRMYTAARQLLLDVAAAVPLDPTALEARRAHVAREITRLDRLEAAGLEPEIDVLHQARSALARGELDVLHAALAALELGAIARRDPSTAARSAAALRILRQGHDGHARDAVAASRERSGRDVLGDDVLRAVAAGYARARIACMRTAPGAAPASPAVRDYVAEGAEHALVAAALAADGCFEVGGVLSPTRIVEHETVTARVRFPTQDLRLEAATEPADLPDAIIDDPRTVLLSLATGRLLARRYVRTETRARSRTVMRGEVRIYVLDGSSSMLGPRARMRDAILLAELATLRRRLGTRGRAGRVTLYYRYFTKIVGPTTRVDSIEGVDAAIATVLGELREGGTDIDAALLASFEQVRDARERDPDLARAQLVLVTDGEAAIDAARITAAREGVGELPVGLSVIALGQENAALRELVAAQRARGERAFYHFVGDEALGAAAQGEIDEAPAIHLPTPRGPAPDAERLRALRDELGVLLDEMAGQHRAREIEVLEALEHTARARREAGLSEAELEFVGEGERARADALARDRRALDLRFARWFPDPSLPPTSPVAAASAPSTDEIDATVVALAAVAEVVAVTAGSPLSRQADAIQILERLLPDAQLSPARYEAVLRLRHPDVAHAVLAVRAAVAPR